MPLGLKPECIQCHSQETAMWRTTELGAICNECNQKHKEEERQLALSQQKEESTSRAPADLQSSSKITLRKSTRMARNYKTRLNPYAVAKTVASKGKGRRSIFKKTPMKAPTSVATTTTHEVVYHKGSYLRVGDIVSLQDVGGGIYFAQLRGLLSDAYGEKSGVISWLLPTKKMSNGVFCPSCFIIGPDEELPRRLDCMQFVLHAPSDYFKSRTSPYPPLNTVPVKRPTRTRMGI